MKKICVIGSLNMDIVANVDAFPSPGQTVMGKALNEYYGGKGANQAIAIGKLGGVVAMVGMVGDDIYGSRYIEHLKLNNVNTDYVSVHPGVKTGTAIIEVEKSGENRIIIIPGSNALVDCVFIESLLASLLDFDIFLLQQEIPVETNLEIAKFLKVHNKVVILDPAPAVQMPEEMYRYVDYITPNETELKFMTKVEVVNLEDLKYASLQLLAKGVKRVVAKSGGNGSYLITEDTFVHIPAFKVTPIDTTAAGDSFNAGLAYALANDHDDEQAIQLANAVGALSTLGYGAQSAMPSLDQLNVFLNEYNVKFKTI